MKKQKKRNKAFNPNKHRINSAAAFQVIQKAHDAAYDASPLDAEQVDELGAGYYLAFALVKSGKGTKDNIGTLAGAINISIVLAESGVGLEYLPLLLDARDAIVRTGIRANTKCKIGFNGLDIHKVSDALNIHDMQVLVTSKTQMIEAVNEVRKRINEGNFDERLAA